MRPRIFACSLENPASENIHAAKEKRFFRVRLKARLALVSDWAQCQMDINRIAAGTDQKAA